MVTKQEIYGGQGALGGGITSVVQKRQSRFLEEEQKRQEREVEQANEYINKINAGEIKNINQIPQNLWKYTGLQTQLEQTKSELSKLIEETKNKENKLQEEYNNRLKALQEWKSKKLDRAKTSEDKKRIREDYDLEREYLREEYKPRISYERGYANELNRKINDINAGEILSKDYILASAKSYARYKEKSTEYEYNKNISQIKQEQVSKYVEQINQGKISLSDVPSNLRQYIVSPSTQPSTGGQSIQQPIKIDSGSIRYIVDASGKLTGVEDVFNQQSRQPTIQDKLLFETIKSTPDYLQKYETSRYQSYGLSPAESKYLGTESAKLGGVTFTPEYIQKVLYESKKIGNDINIGGLKYKTDSQGNLIGVEDVLNRQSLIPNELNIILFNLEKKKQNEIERYRGYGYSTEEAKILGSASLSRGGISFTPQEANKIILEKKIADNYKKTFDDIKSIWSNLIKSTNFVDLDRDFISRVGKTMNTLLQDLAYRLSVADYKYVSNTLNTLGSQVNKLKDDLESYPNLTEKEKKYITERIDDINKKIQYGEKQKTTKEEMIKFGGTTTTSKIIAGGYDVALDLAIPGKGYVDLLVLLNQIVPNKEDFVKVYNTIKSDGIKETVNRLGEGVVDKVNNFFTNKEEKKEIEEILKENEKEIKEIQNGVNSGIYDKDSANKYISDLKYQNRQLNEYKRNLVSNSIATYATLAYIAVSLGKGYVDKRLQLKKANLDLDNARSAANNYNKLEAGKEIQKYDQFGNRIPNYYVEDTYTGLKFTKANLDDLADINIIKKGQINLDDIAYVKTRVTSKEINGGATIKKILDKVERAGKTADIPYYTLSKKPNFFQNVMDVTIQLKDGRILGFSIVSKSSKDLSRLAALQKNKQLMNVLKYGTNKKIILSSKLSGTDDIIAGVQYKTRAGKLTAEDYWLGRQVPTKAGDVTVVKRKALVIEQLKKDRTKIMNMNDEQLQKLSKQVGLSVDEILQQTRLTAEDYWGLSEPISITQTKKIATSKTKEIERFKDTGTYGYSADRTLGVIKSKNFDVEIDTSAFSLSMQRTISNMKELKRTGKKLTASQEMIIKIGDKVDNAIKSGKTQLLLESKEINKLQLDDFSKIQSSITQTAIPKSKFKDIATKIDKQIVTATTNTNRIGLLKKPIDKKIQEITSQISSASWTGINKTQADKLTFEVEQATKTLTAIDNATKTQTLIIQKDIKALDETIASLSQAVQTTQLQSVQLLQLQTQQQKLKNALMNLNQIGNLTKSNLDRLRPIKQTIPSITIKIPKLPSGQKEAKDIELGKDEYGIFARKKGKDYLVGKKKTKKEARKLLFGELGNTLRASGFIKKGDKKIKVTDLSKDFRYSKTDSFRVVEKKHARINTPGERRELKASRKKTKQKSAYDYWFR